MEEARHEVHSLLDSIELNDYLLTKPPCGVYTIAPENSLAETIKVDDNHKFRSF
jgi:hypothetical protein